ncbi:TIR domain-containing protein [Sphingomonas sp. G124]|uniref:TIR domain-containing protein n=1 Tax=Sphingomonas cremea TaxID=2904799 RepID=A0A9X1QJ18_9SPHN|nr:TIR domain-containing protein [Sphingomonas cremea]MCF2514305.1 TIR domain-containing protein [Sphingomonas cremea]
MASDENKPAGQAPATLFLSYARADRTRAERLADALTNAGYTVWWDALIEGGAQFAASIRKALETADAVIVLWSKNSVDSDWVRDEAALGRDRHRLIPLALDGTRPPLGFRQYQAIDVSHWRGKPDAPQIAAIHRAIAAATGQGPVFSSTAQPISRRGMLAIGTGAGVLAIGGGAFVAWRSGLIGPAQASGLSIAVLPFRNLSGDSDQDFLSEGLTEEIRAALARNPALKVLAATSSNAAHDLGDDVKSITRELGVKYLLEGSVRRAGDTVRVSTDLTDGKTGFSQWSQTVDRKLTDLFAFQSEIAATVSNAMSVRVATSAPAPGGTHNVRAYENFLRGRALFNQAKDEESDRQALALYELAIAADPKFAMAHAARSRALSAIAVQYAKADELKQLYAEAITAAHKAIELAPNLAEGHLALGFALFTGKLDVAGARPFYERAYQLGRGNADILLLYALYCSRAGRPEDAREAIARAVALDPLNPRTYRASGSIDYAARRYADALPPLDKALKLNPKITSANALRGNSLMQLGRLPEARAAFDAEPQNMFKLTGLAIVDRRLGDGAAAKKAYDQLVSEVGDAALYQQAQVLAQWGRSDEALTALERARAVGDSGLIYLSTDPLLDPIRDQPRFRNLLNAIART